MAKDLFSQQAQSYALYRPSYPKELFDYILSFVEERKLAWDCATGNGQCALPLSAYFEKVIASDISERQMQQAPRKENIEYLICPAEKTPFAPNSFNLITIAQAYHWIDWEKFHLEANRVGKKNCVVAIWMYDLLQAEEPELNECIRWFYKEIVGPYWDAERKHIDDHYSKVLFEFTPLPSKNFSIHTSFSKEELLGYFSTWSAVQHYIKAKGESPIELMCAALSKTWSKEEKKPFSFPVYLKIGKTSS